MDDELVLNRSLIPLLSTLTAESVVLLLYLVDRAYVQRELGVGLSIAEAARYVGISTQKVKVCLVQLGEQGLVQVVPKEEYVELRIPESVAQTGGIIPFSFANTDSTKIHTLENEMRRLRLQNEAGRRGQKSGLTDIYKGEEGNLYAEIEKRGWAIGADEAVLLGKCLVKFGVERTQTTYRQMRNQKNPIRATYAALERGIQGKGAKQVESEPFTKVHYKEL